MTATTSAAPLPGSATPARAPEPTSAPGVGTATGEAPAAPQRAPAGPPERAPDPASELAAAADPTGHGAGRSDGQTVSRRSLLIGGMVLLPGLLGSRALTELAGPLLRGAGATRADTGAAAGASARTAGVAGTAPGQAVAAPAAPAYDASQHAWAFICDTTTCIGCGHCVVACKNENKVPTDPEHNRTWIELHVVTQDGAIHVASPDGGINGPEPELAGSLANGEAITAAYFVPRLCMQCANPPCVNVCPVSATYRNPDGVILVDETRCIGCGFCMVACPYGARYIVPNGSQAPKGVAGVADKCTFCYHRITKGMPPACVEVCPVGARQFGDLNDPASPINVTVNDQRTQVLKPGLGTKPRVHYIGLEAEVG
jgi:tetrathionate reductase subunit B